MRVRLPTLLLLATALGAGSTTGVDTAAAPGAAAPASAQATAPVAPLNRLVSQVDIPYESFTLPNGLRVYVHEDRKAPVVAVSIWYHVGSKDEPKGRTGFAHLFEHLMFNGSENAPGDFFAPLQEVGATDYNGTTWFDRTNYFETVPTPALERALFLESDRMGYLLGAVTQANLKNQIGVVQNEKRQGDNQPYGLVEYAQLEALFPEGHPYRHSTIGSMADLDAASLDDVKNWFRQNYGPNNAVLVLAGDVDVATARRLVTQYFGAIPRGPEPREVEAAVPTLPAPKAETMTDRVATTRIYRMWAVPGLLDDESVALDVAAGVLGGLSSSRLDNALVRDEKLAVAVSTGNQSFEKIGMFEISADVRPGVDPATVARRMDEIVAQFLAEGPTEDEVRRVATQSVAGRIRGLESVGGFGGKAVTLAEGALYADDPELYKKQLRQLASIRPAEVRQVASKWLSRPVYALTVAPGERKAYEEGRGGQGGQAKAEGTSAPAYYRVPAAGEKPLAPASKITVASEPVQLAQAAQRRPAQAQAQPRIARPQPPLGPVQNVDFPDIQRARLSNGVQVVYAQRTAVPATRVAVSFDAGNAADSRTKLGTQSLMLALLDEGTTTRNSRQIAEEQERLGASIGAGATMDRTTVSLSALSANLQPSLDLLADIVRNPAFDPAEVERLRAQQLARISAELTQPQGLALRALPPALFGRDHPYGVPFTGTGDPQAVAKVTRDDLAAFHQAWFRPELSRIYVVSSLPLSEVTPLLERSFGGWTAPAGVPAGAKNLAAPTARPNPRIILVDRPQSPQSVILGGMILPFTGRDDLDTLGLANDVLGGTFLSRLNMDLRETKGWSYGVNGSINRLLGPVPYIVSAPVQANRTGDSIVALRQNMVEFLRTRGVQADERARSVANRAFSLAGRFETSDAVLSGLQSIDLYGWSDDYYERLASRYQGMTAAQLDAAARGALDPSRITWVVVGDAATVRPQLGKLGLPIEQISAAQLGAVPAPAQAGAATTGDR
ncbi:MAG: Zinc protease [uncultured Sphingomonadaceae bacterium]|uniref:Zinc protease n=1 Tax=uncultured Sphingomonadaceae bacterium TaxID=169976 RepID=A0A6J4SII9_9SPHN|nr:MAG: Zinc protease [uncultured Sphingomonadaceae bacterium]